MISLKHSLFLDEVTIRLVNNVDESEGRGTIEIEFNGVKGSVCDDDWDDLDARVVCKMLGYRYCIVHVFDTLTFLK